MIKFCDTCGKVKDVSDFPRLNTARFETPTRRNTKPWCKMCVKTANKADHYGRQKIKQQLSLRSWI